MVVSDHSPCTADLKLMEAGDFLQAWGGIASLQFGRSLEGGELSLPYQALLRIRIHLFQVKENIYTMCIHTHSL